VPKLKERGSW